VEILRVHVSCVALSGGLFAVRGALRVVNSPLANHRLLRITSYLIDTTLLLAAILLTTIVRQYPFVNAWLTAKVVLLVLYIATGIVALKHARSQAQRAAMVGAALTIYLLIIGVAITHRPAGWWSFWH
jgi:uncharacterized membrane protein SirB2